MGNTQQAREILQQARTVVIQWAEHKDMLFRHIQNGVARGLYPQVVADTAHRYLDQVMEIETDNLADAAMGAAATE